MSGKILLIDDEDKMRRLLERVLRRTGFEVDSTDSQAEAIDLVGGKTFQLAIVGLRLSAVDVIDFIKRLSKAGHRNKCILLMDHPGMHLLRDEAKQCAAAIFMRPYDLNELESSVLQAMECP
ncbi:MAG: response regulator [Thermodesulfovibrionales bacterium]